MKLLEIPMKDVPINGHTNVFDFRRHESPEMFIVFMVYKEFGERLWGVEECFKTKTDKLFFLLDRDVAVGILKYCYDDRVAVVTKFT